jgi:hypothetical protein
VAIPVTLFYATVTLELFSADFGLMIHKIEMLRNRRMSSSGRQMKITQRCSPQLGKSSRQAVVTDSIVGKKVM